MKYRGPKVKLSRQLGLPLTPRAAQWLERRPYPPGEHGSEMRQRRQISDFMRN